MPLRAILHALVAERSPDVRAVIFCDEEGERVEAVSREPNTDPYELDLVGASYCAISRHVDPDEGAIRVVCSDAVVHVRMLVRGYYVVAVAEPGAVQPVVDRGLARVGEALIEHM
jgi:hypothetical protein